jgi:malic enzyme
MVDTKGLITVTRGDKLAEHKVAVARRDGTPDMKSLKDIVAYVKPHALIGLSGAGPAFTQVCCRLLAQLGPIRLILVSQ